MRLEREGSVVVLDLGDPENRINRDFVDAFHDAVVEVAAADRPRALVVTGSGKFWSNGYDLDWMAANADSRPAFMTDNYALWADVLTAPFPTIAALQGHAFGAGAALALAHDQRTMRADRGYFCLPEVAIGMAFPPAMAALVQAKLAPPVAHHAMTTGQRYGGQQAADAAIADEAADEAGVLSRAVERAAALAASSDPATLGRIKEVMYAPVIAALRVTS